MFENVTMYPAIDLDVSSAQHRNRRTPITMFVNIYL